MLCHQNIYDHFLLFLFWWHCSSKKHYHGQIDTKSFFQFKFLQDLNQLIVIHQIFKDHEIKQATATKEEVKMVPGEDSNQNQKWQQYQQSEGWVQVLQPWYLAGRWNMVHPCYWTLWGGAHDPQTLSYHPDAGSRNLVKYENNGWLIGYLGSL